MFLEMASAPSEYDLDLALFEDEHLVVWVQMVGFEPARNELMCRCLPLSKRLIGHYASHSHLQDADRLDAQQDAVLWTLEAIGHYRIEESVRSGGCRFRSFLVRVLKARFVDFLRHQYCRQRRLCLCDFLGEQARQPQWRWADVASVSENPEQIVAENEQLTRLRARIGELDHTMQHLWESLLTMEPLRRIARRLRCSYDRIKRQRRKLLHRLQVDLAASDQGQPADGGHPTSRGR